MYENIYLDLVEYEVLRLKNKEVCKFQENSDFCVVFAFIGITRRLSVS